MITAIAILRDGEHRIWQIDPGHGQNGVMIGSAVALRREHYGSDLEKVVVIDGRDTIEIPGG
jgi:hypothetical protein